jgi:uncharacterized protein YecT (DUF1311 family)
VRKIRNAWSFIVICGFFPALAYAQEESPYSAENSGTPQYKQCVSFASSKVEKQNCLGAELVRQEAFLKLALNENLEGMPSNQKAQILAAQKAWVVYRDKNCRVRILNNGSGAGIFYLGCLIRETITRRIELSTAWDY